MATAKKTATKKVNAPSAILSDSESPSAKYFDPSERCDQLEKSIFALREEMAALKARLFHPSEN